MKSVLITGCNRGIGLGLVRQLVREKNPPKSLIATCRSIPLAQELQAISKANTNVHLLEFDVSNFNSYDKFVKDVCNIVQGDGLNVLFNNAGASPKSTRINMVKSDQMIDTYTVNTVAPIMLTKAFLPLLKTASKINNAKPLGAERSCVINMSSILGSIAANKEGGLFPYRCSKAALNMATKSLSVDLYKDGIVVACIHPGWVRTDMGGSNAPLKVEEITPQLIQLLHNLNEASTGKFYQYDGTELEW